MMNIKRAVSEMERLAFSPNFHKLGESSPESGEKNKTKSTPKKRKQLHFVTSPESHWLDFKFRFRHISHLLNNTILFSATFIPL